MQTALSRPELLRALGHLGAAPSLLSASRVCLATVVGGYQANHERGPGWRIVWSGSSYPWWLGRLPSLLGLRRAIAEFTEAGGLAAYADAAADYGMEICACSIQAAPRVVEAFRSGRPHSTDILYVDPTSIIWSHVAESEDWCYVRARCGAECPGDLREAIEDIESW